MERNAIAHNIQTDGEVGATFHIEPNHNPKAGEEARAWFALTRKGGEPIPLSACECRLQVYDRHGNLTLEPAIAAIDAERYEDIPSATIIFPEAGSYELVLNGRPQDGASFEPFQLSYTVNVTTGSPVVATPSPVTETPGETSLPPAQERTIEGLLPVGIGLAIVVAGIVAIVRKKI